jgi:hypothetical protein
MLKIVYQNTYVPSSVVGVPPKRTELVTGQSCVYLHHMTCY